MLNLCNISDMNFLKRILGDFNAFISHESGKLLLRYIIKNPRFNLQNLNDFLNGNRGPDGSQMLGVKGSNFQEKLDNLAEYMMKWPEKVMYADTYCRKPIGCPMDYYDIDGIYRRTNLCEPKNTNEICQVCNIGKMKLFHRKIVEGIEADDEYGPNFYIIGKSKPFFEFLLKRTVRMWNSGQQEYMIVTGCSYTQKLFVIPIVLLGWKGYIRILQYGICDNSAHYMHGEFGNKNKQTQLSDQTIENTEYILQKVLEMKGM